MQRAGEGGGGGQLSTPPSRRWACLITDTCEHAWAKKQRAFVEAVDELLEGEGGGEAKYH